MKIIYWSVLIQLGILYSFHLNAQNRPGIVSLTGKINYADNQIQLEDMSELKDLQLQSDVRTFIPDSLGSFSLAFFLNKPNYFRIGRNILYLSPGDSLFMNIDYYIPENSSFTGNSRAINEYLKYTPYPKMGSFLVGEDNIKSSIQETINAIFVLAKEKEKLLHSYEGIPKDLKRLETARIEADIVNSLYYLNIFYAHVHKIKIDSIKEFKRQYQLAINPYLKRFSKKVHYSSFLKLEVYRLLISNIVDKFPGHTEFSIQIRDWLTSKQIVQQIKGFTNKDSIIVLKSKASKIKSSIYKNEVINSINNSIKFRNGDIAIDFVAVDINDNLIPLSSFLGKVIFIDLWATWCGPCLQEIPYLNKLKEKYASNSDIIFISLSIDDNKNAWKKELLTSNVSGNQFIIDRSKLKDYSVTEIPRTIIIDKEFKVIEISGPLPSSQYSVKIIDALLKKSDAINKAKNVSLD